MIINHALESLLRGVHDAKPKEGAQFSMELKRLCQSVQSHNFNGIEMFMSIVVRTLKPFKDTLDKVVPENVTGGLTCRVSSAMDAVTKRLSEISVTNRLLIQGRRLGISPDNPDEGVWLVDSRTGERVATSIVEYSDAQTIDCVFNELPPPGMYTLVVSCRDGKRESLNPAIARVKNFRVL